MDFLSEFLAQKSREFLTGTYYKRRPVTNADGGEKFSYENLDPHTREYKTVIGTLLIEGRTAAIKTRSAINFKTKQFIVTQDGQLWEISLVTENPQVKETEDALRIFKTTAETEKVIRLVGIENPKGIK